MMQLHTRQTPNNNSNNNNIIAQLEKLGVVAIFVPQTAQASAQLWKQSQ